MSQWFRMYGEVLNDPKAQRLDGDLFKIWVNLLCLTCQHEGVLPPVSDIAFALRMNTDDTTKALAALVKAGLLDERRGCYSPHNWNKRQFKSDVSNERVKRHRERRAAVTRNVTETVTVTPPDTETEADTEQSRAEQKDSPAPSGAGEPSASDLEMEFDLWWLCYPRKQDRGHALKAFKRVRKSGIALETLTTATRKYAAERAGQDAQFTKLGATWLNGQCWLDESSTDIAEREREQFKREIEEVMNRATA